MSSLVKPGTNMRFVRDQAKDALALARTIGVLDLRSQLNKDAVVSALESIVEATNESLQRSDAKRRVSR